MGRLELLFKFNKRVGKSWCCLTTKWPQVIASRMEYLLENNRQACLFIRDLRVTEDTTFPTQFRSECLGVKGYRKHHLK